MPPQAAAGPRLAPRDRFAHDPRRARGLPVHWKGPCTEAFASRWGSLAVKPQNKWLSWSHLIFGYFCYGQWTSTMATYLQRRAEQKGTVLYNQPLYHVACPEQSRQANCNHMLESAWASISHVRSLALSISPSIGRTSSSFSFESSGARCQCVRQSKLWSVKPISWDAPTWSVVLSININDGHILAATCPTAIPLLQSAPFLDEFQEDMTGWYVPHYASPKLIR